MSVCLSLTISFLKTVGLRSTQKYMLVTVGKISLYPDKSQTLCFTNNLTGLAVTTGKVMNMAELSEVRGRAWEDVDVSSFSLEPYTRVDMKKVLLTCTLVYQALRSQVESICCTMSCSVRFPALASDVKTPDGREFPQKLKGS